jgi:2-haloalkanoic acid dehalogenase type II
LDSVRAIAFDCYGTLIDFSTDSFIRAMADIAREQGHEADGQALWDAWLDGTREYARLRGFDPVRPLDGPEPSFETFRERWPTYFRHAFDRVNIDADPHIAYQAMDRILSEATIYPEVPEALQALSDRYQLAVLSNADEDHLQKCLRRNALRFPIALSSEAAASYKPHPRIFERLLELMADLPDSGGVFCPAEVLYVGDSPYADVQGAKNFGMPAVWLNRYSAEYPAEHPEPDLVITDLRQLPAVLHS